MSDFIHNDLEFALLQESFIEIVKDLKEKVYVLLRNVLVDDLLQLICETLFCEHGLLILVVEQVDGLHVLQQVLQDRVVLLLAQVEQGNASGMEIERFSKIKGLMFFKQNGKDLKSLVDAHGLKKIQGIWSLGYVFQKLEDLGIID